MKIYYVKQLNIQHQIQIMENNFKFLLKETTTAVNRVHSIPSQENKANALVFLKTITQLVEDMKVESPKEIKKKQLGKLTKAELLAMLVDDECSIVPLIVD